MNNGKQRSGIHKQRPLQQSRIDLAALQSRGSSSGSSSSSSRPPPKAHLRQASIFQMPGVVDYREAPAEADDALAGVATSLYLGEEDLIRLRDTLDDSRDDDQTLLTVLKRLSAMPITRACLESTRIGVSVGHLRKHRTKEVADFAERIVGVWKRQLAEHKAQATAAARRGRS